MSTPEERVPKPEDMSETFDRMLHPNSIVRQLTRREVTSTIVQYGVFLKQFGSMDYNNVFDHMLSEIEVAPIQSSGLLSPSMKREKTQMAYAGDTKQIAVTDASPPTKNLDERGLRTLGKVVEWEVFYGKGHGERSMREPIGLSELTRRSKGSRESMGDGFVYEDFKEIRDIIRDHGAKDIDVFLSQKLYDGMLEQKSGKDMLMALEKTRGLYLNPTPALDPIKTTRKELHERMAQNGSRRGLKIESVMENGGTYEDLNLKFMFVLLKPDNNYETMREDVVTVPALEYDAHAKTKFVVSREGNEQIEPGSQLLVYKQESPDNENFYLIDRQSIVDNERSITEEDRQKRNLYIDVRKHPRSSDIFIGDTGSETLAIAELLPPMKLPMARVNAMSTISYNMYFSVMLYQPNQWAMLSNVVVPI